MTSRLQLLLLELWPTHLNHLRCSQALRDLLSTGPPLHWLHFPEYCCCTCQFCHRDFESRLRETVSSSLVPPSPVHVCPQLPPESYFSLSLASSPLFCIRTRREQAREARLVLLHKLRYASPVFHSSSCRWFASRNSSSNLTMRLSWSQNECPIPSPPLYYSPTTSNLDPPVVKYLSVASPSLLAPQHVAISQLLLVYSFLYLVLQLAISSYFFLFYMKKNPCRWDPISGSASLAHCVLRKRQRISTPCSFENHRGKHPSTAASALPMSWAPSLGPQSHLSVSWFPPHTAEHVSRMRNTRRRLHSQQEYVKIALQRLLSCISVNLALFQSGQQPFSATIYVRVTQQRQAVPSIRVKVPRSKAYDKLFASSSPQGTDPIVSAQGS